jgi:hypothetical protein
MGGIDIFNFLEILFRLFSWEIAKQGHGNDWQHAMVMPGKEGRE